MSLKRKAIDGVQASERGAKRASAGPSTPSSYMSDSDYAGSDHPDSDADQSESEHIKKARAKLDFSSITPKQSHNSSRSFGVKDFAWQKLKPDHANRPIWIDPAVLPGSRKGPKLTLEIFSPLGQQATDLLTTIAEPQSRPSHMHEYRFSEHSLYAALSVGLKGNDIIRALEKFSKTPVPDTVIEFIQRHTKAYGKIRMVLRDNRFFVESEDRALIEELLRDPVIGPCARSQIESGTLEARAAVIQGTKEATAVRQAQTQNEPAPRPEPRLTQQQSVIDDLLDEEGEEEDDVRQLVNQFEIENGKRDIVAKQCLDIGYPAVSEYDFEGDTVNPNLPIDLKASTQIRPYQEKALSKMFGNGRGKSGIIVLPCGAGKTLVGITAACHIKKSVMVLCTSAMSTHQWANEFRKWSEIDEQDIAVFTANDKKQFARDSGVLVSTYSIVTSSGKRAHDTQKMMDWIMSREWGLMILDEVHVVPARMFRKVGAISAHCKLGLTATLLREDDKIGDLNFLIGPKLYEANWMELADQGHIAKVQCAEVWCPMSMEFYQEYQRETNRRRALYYMMNPIKYQVCQFLIDYHEKRGDKIIVFSDNIFALEHYAKSMGKYFISGQTSNNERIDVLNKFQNEDSVRTLFLSKVGDTSLDLPEATCLIQISSHYGSRRQEAQRLGRILRAKKRNEEGFNAFFYSLVSKDTNEMHYSAKRQAFLVDQGYAFKTIVHLAGMSEMVGLRYRTKQERMELLSQVALQSETSADIEKVVDDNLWGGLNAANPKGGSGKVKRQTGLLADASGGGVMAPLYREQESRRGGKKQKGPDSEWFKKEARRREAHRKKRAAAEGN
ncbi:DNA repair helicase RAD25 [Cyphellophora attinorum]|uniref:DNA 3'-5' helicase n=1 Tax=Cyphellophora attinorum TaxID=1664694 RepID=A0A0N0NKM3_9EURO|nr:DNA repair helicase RAD25 [Phialophora attinorum]KPI38009.1 DNA repair helicase RAD25 [Phialophora attinorum]